MRSQRIIDGALIAGVVVALIGTAVLFKFQTDAADENSALVCSLGTLISDAPIAKRPDETPADFADRIRLIRKFARDLRALDECDPEHPIRVRIPVEDRDALQRGRSDRPPRRADRPSDATNARSQGGDRPGPPPSGGGLPGGSEPPSATEAIDQAVDDTTDAVDETVDGATDTACDLTQDPDGLC